MQAFFQKKILPFPRAAAVHRPDAARLWAIQKQATKNPTEKSAGLIGYIGFFNGRRGSCGRPCDHVRGA
jgi:hypothetical protein